jgi:hypothetical protein
MNKQGQLGVGMIVVLAVAIILGAVFMVAITDQQSILTNKQSVANQSVDVESAWINATAVNESIEFSIYTQSDWKQEKCPLTSVVMRNMDGDALTVTTDYVLDADEGTFTLVDTANNQDSNITYVDYSYCADGYNPDSGSRGIAGLISLFFAFAVLSIAVLGIREWIK